MNGRSIFVLLALSISPWTLPACGGDDPPKKTNQLEGTYRPSDPGAIASVTFKGGKDYLYMPSGCASQQCADIGTYTIDGDNLVLENAKAGTQRTIQLQVLQTTPASGSLVQSLRPADLTDPGTQLTTPGQQTATSGNPTASTGNPTATTGNQTATSGNQTATSGNQLDGQASQLLQTITQALMNAQQMNQDNGQNGGQQGGQQGGGQQGGQPDNGNPQKPMIDCKADAPTKDTPPGLVAAYFAACPNGP